MTYDTNGWPEEYSDPRDRPHADTLRVTVESLDKYFADIEEYLGKIDRGEDVDPQPKIVTLASVDDLRKLLTDRRLELLQNLVDKDDAAESILALADELGRDYRTVHDDVTLLSEYGIVYLVEDGNTKRPYVPYERIIIDVEIVAASNRSESASV